LSNATGLTDVVFDASKTAIIVHRRPSTSAAVTRMHQRERGTMANIDWHIIGHIDPEGRIRISGFSFGGDELFDSPIDLDEMIDALAASHEMPPDLLLSPAGRKELTQLATVLSKAGTGVTDRLRDDKSRSKQVQLRDNDEKNQPD
jgi:hypothetical protein